MGKLWSMEIWILIIGCYLLPEELVDYVFGYELAHRKEMNHSNAFLNVVKVYASDYKERKEKTKGVSYRIRKNTQTS